MASMLEIERGSRNGFLALGSMGFGTCRRTPRP
jgi:hypothetical protein